jgi:fibronectin-binding autotransporter adhesin
MTTQASLRTFLVLTAGSLLAASAQAQLTWDANNTGAGQTNGAGAWLGTNQWWDATLETNQDWVSGSAAIFGGPATAGGAVTLASPTTVESFTFNAYTGTYTLGTATQLITLDSGITKNAGSAAASFASPITLSGAQTWTNNSTGTLTTANGANLIDNGGNQLTIDGTGNTTFGVINNDAVSITGSGALVKNGSGTLSLGGVNAGFTGDITVHGGVLRVTKPTSITGNLNLAGGVYEHYWSDAYTRTLGIGAGQIQITGGASGFSENGATGVTFTLNNNAAFELVWGDALFNPSTFVLQADSAQGTSSLTLANKLDLNGVDRTIRVSGGTTGAARATISGQIRTSTGTAGITKTGAGYLALSNGSNAWNGATTVNGGILDLAGITNANLSGGSGRNVTVAAGAAIRFNALSNAYLNRIVETTDEIGVMTGTTGNNFDFSSSTGATLPNAFLGNWAGNGAKAEISGAITPGSNGYKFGAKGSSGLLGIRDTLSGANSLTVGMTGSSGIRVNIVAANTHTGETVINTGSRLTLGNNLALQNSPLNVGSAGGNFSLAAGTNGGKITGETAAASPTFGGLVGSRNLITVFSNAAGNNETNLARTAVTGFTLNVGTALTHTYSGTIGGFGAGTTGTSPNFVGGDSTLTKTGEGTQVLDGIHTYTGATTITGGTLALGTAGSIAGSASVAIGAGATLDVSAKTSYEIPAAQPVTFGINADDAGSSGRIVAAELDIEDAVVTFDITGTPDDPVYVLATYTTLVGSAFASVPAPPAGYTLEYAYLGNQIALVGGGGPGPVDHFEISAIASPQTVGTAITGITITAQDASNQTATSFTGTVTFGGTGGFSGTSASFTAGVLSGVSVTPTTAGDNLTLTVDDGAGHTGSTVIATIQSQYQAWAGGAAFDGDANGDGVANGLAWLLGAANPAADATGLLPAASENAGDLVLTFSFLNSASRGGATLSLQHSGDLGLADPWASVLVPESTGTVGGVGFTVTPDGNFNDVTATIPATEAVDDRLFGRLESAE